MTKSKIQEDIEIAARILHEAGAKEVFVFGSAARGTMKPESDLDLAVRGLPPELFYDTGGRVAIAISRSLDLVDLDEEGVFCRYLEEKGELKRVA